MYDCIDTTKLKKRGREWPHFCLKIVTNSSDDVIRFHITAREAFGFFELFSYKRLN